MGQEGRAAAPRDRAARHRQGLGVRRPPRQARRRRRQRVAARRVRRDDRRRCSRRSRTRCYSARVAYRERAHAARSTRRTSSTRSSPSRPKKKPNDPTPIHGGFALDALQRRPGARGQDQGRPQGHRALHPARRRASPARARSPASRASSASSGRSRTDVPHELPQVPGRALAEAGYTFACAALRRRVGLEDDVVGRCSRSARPRWSSCRGSRARSMRAARRARSAASAMQTVNLGTVDARPLPAARRVVRCGRAADGARGSEALPRRPQAARDVCCTSSASSCRSTESPPRTHGSSSSRGLSTKRRQQSQALPAVRLRSIVRSAGSAACRRRDVRPK